MEYTNISEHRSNRRAAVIGTSAIGGSKGGSRFKRFMPRLIKRSTWLIPLRHTVSEQIGPKLRLRRQKKKSGNRGGKFPGFFVKNHFLVPGNKKNCYNNKGKPHSTTSIKEVPYVSIYWLCCKSDSFFARRN